MPFAWQGARISRQEYEVALVLLRGKSKKAGGTAVGPTDNIRFRQGKSEREACMPCRAAGAREDEDERRGARTADSA